VAASAIVERNEFSPSSKPLQIAEFELRMDKILDLA